MRVENKKIKITPNPFSNLQNLQSDGTFPQDKSYKKKFKKCFTIHIQYSLEDLNLSDVVQNTYE